MVNTSNGNRAVTLERVVAKLKLTVNDEIPAGCIVGMHAGDVVLWAELSDGCTRDGYQWDQAISISIPANYVGTSGQLGGFVLTNLDC